jgi:hypothetical protein
MSTAIARLSVSGEHAAPPERNCDPLPDPELQFLFDWHANERNDLQIGKGLSSVGAV